MSVVQPSSPSRHTNQPAPPTTPPSRRYLPPYIYRSSPSSSASASPLSVSPSSSSPSRSLSRNSSVNSPRSVDSSELPTVTAAGSGSMARGQHTHTTGAGSGGGSKRTPVPASHSTPHTPSKFSPQQQRDTAASSTPLAASSGSGGSSDSSGGSSGSASHAPASPDVLSPASIKSIIPTRQHESLNTPVKLAPSTRHSDSPPVTHTPSGQRVKRAVEQLSSGTASGSAGTSDGSGGKSGANNKRPSISAHIAAGTVAQRVADYYSTAAAATGNHPSSQPPDMPHSAAAVAELINHFSPMEPASPDIQHTQHKWTAAHPQQQRDAGSNAHSHVEEYGSDDKYSRSVEARVEVGQAEVTSDEQTGSLHSRSPLPSEQSPQSAALLTTSDVQPHHSSVIEAEMERASPAASTTPQQTKLSKKQKKAQATANRLQQHAELTTAAATTQPHPHDAQLQSAHKSVIDPQSADKSVASLPRSEPSLGRLVQRVWHCGVLSVWAALLMCAADLFLRQPNWESATLCGLAATAVIDNSLRLVTRVQPTTSTGSVGRELLTGLTAIAASALPFMFTQTLAARSTIYVSHTRHAHSTSPSHFVASLSSLHR